MADYIDRQATIDKINERQRKLIYCFGFENDAVKIMDIAKSIVIAIPSAQPEIEPADVAPVVRCKDCKFYTSMRPDIKTGICDLNIHFTGDDDFCSHGERRKEDT